MALLTGKLAIVTGASSGIGLATARVLAAEGAKVFITGRNEEALKALATEIDAGIQTGIATHIPPLFTTAPPYTLSRDDREESGFR